jgi:homoserine dehydrogenase
VSEPLGVALLGCGTVGGGVASVLLEQPGRMTARAGRPLELRRVAVRDPGRARDVTLPPGLLSGDPEAAVRAPSIDIVVELIGGVELPRKLVLAALASGKHVVTANKALLAHHGPEIYEAARAAGRAVAFEAAVCGGVPVIAALGQSLSANEVRSLQGILNGTCNFILTAMAERQQGYAEALAEAQRLGYAEADPTLDVDGSDAAHKLCVLAQVAFGVTVPPESVGRRGIADLEAMDLRFAAELGYTIKLLAEAWLDPATAELALQVAPVLLRHSEPLARVRGAFNAVQVVGDVVGETFYHGPGAGRMPTASAVLADIIDIASGRAQRTFATLRYWTGNGRRVHLRAAESVPSRFYLRLLVEDRPGVLAEVARVLAEERISIASVIQHEAIEGAQEPAVVPLVIMTHAAPTGRFRAAAARIDTLPAVTGPGVHFSVGD